MRDTRRKSERITDERILHYFRLVGRNGLTTRQVMNGLDISEHGALNRLKRCAGLKVEKIGAQKNLWKLAEQ